MDASSSHSLEKFNELVHDFTLLIKDEHLWAGLLRQRPKKKIGSNNKILTGVKKNSYNDAAIKNNNDSRCCRNSNLSHYRTEKIKKLHKSAYESKLILRTITIASYLSLIPWNDQYDTFREEDVDIHMLIRDVMYYLKRIWCQSKDIVTSEAGFVGVCLSKFLYHFSSQAVWNTMEELLPETLPIISNLVQHYLVKKVVKHKVDTINKNGSTIINTLLPSEGETNCKVAAFCYLIKSVALIYTKTLNKKYCECVTVDFLDGLLLVNVHELVDNQVPSQLINFFHTLLTKSSKKTSSTIIRKLFEFKYFDYLVRSCLPLERKSEIIRKVNFPKQYHSATLSCLNSIVAFELENVQSDFSTRNFELWMRKNVRCVLSIPIPSIDQSEQLLLLGFFLYAYRLVDVDKRQLARLSLDKKTLKSVSYKEAKTMVYALRAKVLGERELRQLIDLVVTQQDPVSSFSSKILQAAFEFKNNTDQKEVYLYIKCFLEQGCVQMRYNYFLLDDECFTRKEQIEGTFSSIFRSINNAFIKIEGDHCLSTIGEQVLLLFHQSGYDNKLKANLLVGLLYLASDQKGIMDAIKALNITEDSPLLIQLKSWLLNESLDISMTVFEKIFDEVVQNKSHTSTPQFQWPPLDLSKWTHYKIWVKCNGTIPKVLMELPSINDLQFAAPALARILETAPESKSQRDSSNHTFHAPSFSVAEEFMSHISLKPQSYSELSNLCESYTYKFCEDLLRFAVKLEAPCFLLETYAQVCFDKGNDLEGIQNILELTMFINQNRLSKCLRNFRHAARSRLFHPNSADKVRSIYGSIRGREKLITILFYDLVSELIVVGT